MTILFNFVSILSGKQFKEIQARNLDCFVNCIFPSDNSKYIQFNNNGEVFHYLFI